MSIETEPPPVINLRMFNAQAKPPKWDALGSYQDTYILFGHLKLPRLFADRDPESRNNPFFALRHKATGNTIKMGDIFASQADSSTNLRYTCLCIMIERENHTVGTAEGAPLIWACLTTELAELKAAATLYIFEPRDTFLDGDHFQVLRPADQHVRFGLPSIRPHLGCFVMVVVETYFKIGIDRIELQESQSPGRLAISKEAAFEQGLI
jgi:hypothetical protein